MFYVKTQDEIKILYERNKIIFFTIFVITVYCLVFINFGHISNSTWTNSEFNQK